MERAARLFKSKQVSREVFSVEDVARAAWPTAVGKAIASHTSRLRLVRQTLIVEVEDGTWQRQLHTLSHQILNRLIKVTGSTQITDIEFRIGVPRREAQRAVTRQATLFSEPDPVDEANDIQDAVLKKVFRLSRKKATA